MSTVEPYVYIHILAEKVGEPFQREIVPASCVRGFNYETYKENNRSYKDVCLKFRRSEGAKKLKCYILYSADTYHEVQEYINDAAAKNKRFSKPVQKTFNESNSSNSTAISAAPPAVAEEEVQQTKSKRKATKQLRKENNHNRAQRLINTYVQGNKVIDQEESDQEDEYANINLDNMSTSTPLSARTDNNINKGYLEQIKFYQKKAESYKKKYEELKEAMIDNSESVENRSQCNCAKNDLVFSEFDRIYNFHLTKVNTDSNLSADIGDEMLVQLRRNIQCNSLAYKHAYSATRPSDFISIISKGIYGVKELSRRCVKKQKNTLNKVELDQSTTETIEEEFYNFLRVKGYTFNQIQQELGKLSRHHHNSISIARKQLKTQEKENEINEATARSLQSELDGFNDNNNDDNRNGNTVEENGQ